MKSFFSIILLLTFLSCSKDDSQEPTATCKETSFLETIVVDKNDCLTFTDRSDFKFTFLGFENYVKSHPNNSPHASFSGSLKEGNATFTFYDVYIYEDHTTPGISFTGRAHTGINNIDYTIFFDNIEFTETESEFIFHKATIRFGYYDDEFD